MPKTINWQYFPKSEKPPKEISDVVTCFEKKQVTISKIKKIDADSVLKLLAADLKKQGFQIENKKLSVPVLYGANGSVEKQFLIDAFEPKMGIVLEVEAAAAVINYLFMKDILEASLIDGANYLIIAVRNSNPTTNNQKDFETVCRFLETIYSSNQLRLPLKGVLIIGY
jgi:hypothetical protein